MRTHERDGGTSGSPVRAILSDIGGVLVRDQWKVAAANLTLESGPSGAELEQSLRRNAPRLDLGSIGLREFFDRVRTETDCAVPWGRFRRVAIDTSLVSIPRNFALYRSIRGRGVILTAVTNVGQEIARALDNKFELSSLFDHMVRSSEVGVVKPDAKMYKTALRLSGVQAHEALFIDDSPRYVAAAELMRIPSVLIPRPEWLASRLKPYLPDSVALPRGR